MFKSVGSFIRNMTPTAPRRGDDDDDKAQQQQHQVGTPDTAAESPNTSSLSIDHLEDDDDDDDNNRPSSALLLRRRRGRGRRLPDETPAAEDATAAPAAAAPEESQESQSQSQSQSQQPQFDFGQLYQLLDTQIRLNIGTSVKCGICLSTVQRPTKTPCGHAFCRGCILASLVCSPKCPECNTSLTKRGLNDESSSDYLDPLSKIYKELLVEFGFTPSIYQASFTTLTQKPLKEDEDEDSDGDCESDDENTDKDDETKHLDRLHVAATWQQQALQVLVLPTTTKNSTSNNTSQIQRDENQMVVQANQEAVETAGWTVVGSTAAGGGDDDRDNDTGGEGVGVSVGVSRHSPFKPPPPPPPLPPPMMKMMMMPNTQEILDEAREQQEADYELLERTKSDEEKDDGEENEDSQESSLSLQDDQGGHGSSEGTTTSRKSVSFQTGPAPPTVTERGGRRRRPPRATAVTTTVTTTAFPRQEKDEEEVPTSMTTRVSSPLPLETRRPTAAAQYPMPTSPFPASSLSPIAKASSFSQSSVLEFDNHNHDGHANDADLAPSVAVPTTNESSSTVVVPTTTTTLMVQEKKSESSNLPEPAPRELDAASTAAARAAMPTTTTSTVQEKEPESSKLAENNNNGSSSKVLVEEDSFGALHWTNRLSLTLSPPDNDNTNNTDDASLTSLSLTMTYDDPQNDYRKKRGQEEAEEQQQQQQKLLQHQQPEDEPPAALQEEDDDCLVVEEEDDSQETKVMEGGRPSSEWNDNAAAAAAAAAANDESFSSDATLPMTAADEENSQASTPNSKAGGNKEAATIVDTDANVGDDKKVPANDSSTTAVDQTTVDATSSSAPRGRNRAPQKEATARTGRTTRQRRAQSEPAPANREDGSSAAAFSVGDIVNVQARTWSGINKPGGVARVAKIHPDSSYDVTYVLGGKEFNVDSVFLSSSEETTGKRRRRETAEAALPTHLMQALAAQGFDTTGTVTLEQAQQQAASVVAAANEEKEDKVDQPPQRNRKSNQSTKTKSTLKDVSNYQQSSNSEDAKKVAKKQTAAQKRKSNSTKDNTSKRKRTSKGESVPAEQKKSSIKSASLDDQASGRKRKSGPSTKEVPQSKKKTNGSSKSNTPKASTVSTPTAVPTLSNEEAIKVAGDHYKAHFEAALKENIINVVASGLSEHDMGILKALTNKTLGDDVKIKLSESFGKKTTLCITPLEIDTTTKNATTRLRTAKAMRASMAGIPIVSPAWIQACTEQNAAVVPSEGMVAHSLPAKTDSVSTSQDSDFGVARMAIQVAQKAPPLLHQHSVFFCGDFTSRHRRDLQLLAREAGAKVLTNVSAVSPKPGKSKVVLVCHDTPTGTVISTSLIKQVENALAEEPSSVLVVNPQWIFESITCAKALQVDTFAPINPKAKTLWECSRSTS